MTQKLILPPKTNEALQQFVPESYQWPVIDAIERDGKRNAILCWNRRAGKDITCLNIMVRQALKRRGAYLYMLPQQKQARQVIYQGMTFEGKPLLDYIPKELIARKLEQAMEIHLVNGSIIYFCGSNYYDSYRGISPMGLVMSEAAFSHAQCLPTFIPALERNDAFTLLISTPNGYNWFHDLYESAKESDNWFVETLTINETKTSTPEQIDQQIEDGKISWDMAQSEYYCSFTIGADGSYYARYLNEMELNEQIDSFPWERGKPVHTAFDIGVNDQTCIIFWQSRPNGSINIIDYYASRNVGMDHYISIIKEKPYLYGTHLWPHDGAQRQKHNAQKLDDIAREMGLDPTIVPVGRISTGIEKVRTMLSRININEKTCKPLIKALRDYRKEYDHQRKVYRDTPLHDENSDAADALRTLCMGYEMVSNMGMSAADVKALQTQALYGNTQELPKQLQNFKPGIAGHNRQGNW